MQEDGADSTCRIQNFTNRKTSMIFMFIFISISTSISLQYQCHLHRLLNHFFCCYRTKLNGKLTLQQRILHLYLPALLDAIVGGYPFLIHFELNFFFVLSFICHSAATSVSRLLSFYLVSFFSNCQIHSKVYRGDPLYLFIYFCFLLFLS